MKNVEVQFPHLRTQVEVASFPSQRVLDVGWLCKDIHGKQTQSWLGEYTKGVVICAKHNNKYQQQIYEHATVHLMY